MFPTTVWSTIQQAGQRQPEALEELSARYRPAIRMFIASRGFSDADADDLCQEVFVRLLSSAALQKADPQRGRFRSLMLAIASHVMLDRRRRRTHVSIDERLPEPADRDPDFDRIWILQLAERSLRRLQDEGSVYFEVLRGHLDGQSQDRNRLWNARRRLIAYIRQEIAMTCQTHREFEEEVAYLTQFLRPGARHRPRPETDKSARQSGGRSDDTL